ncbi:MAG: TonB family protein [Cyclobacteriaceae bacterium]|nr:TonB family protein [Cyclobacteriaceae bacterium]
METKKNPSVDLTKKSGYFFSIGLLIAMSLAVMAFEWQQEESFAVITERNQDVPMDWTEVIPTDPTPPAPIPAKNVILVETPETELIESPIFDLDPEDSPETIAIPAIAIDEPEKTEDLPWDIVEVSATPKNGFKEFYKSIGENIQYPSQAKRATIEGKVFVQFVIARDGTLSDFKVLKGIGGGCDEEAVRIIKLSPAWNPGKQRGKPVKQRFTLPITFRLD